MIHWAHWGQTWEATWWGGTDFNYVTTWWSAVIASYTFSFLDLSSISFWLSLGDFNRGVQPLTGKILRLDRSSASAGADSPAGLWFSCVWKGAIPQCSDQYCLVLLSLGFKSCRSCSVYLAIRIEFASAGPCHWQYLSESCSSPFEYFAIGWLKKNSRIWIQYTVFFKSAKCCDCCAVFAEFCCVQSQFASFFCWDLVHLYAHSLDRASGFRCFGARSDGRA